MATRLGGRTGLAIARRIELPTTLRPQIVNNDGYEVDETDEVEEDLRSIGDVEPDATVVLEDGGDVEMEESAEGEEEEVAEGDVQVDEDGELEEKEQLLSIADSLVLQVSLIQTRHRHLTNLLPHIFTHPLIPAHNRPRARPPPKSTFLFPTPPPLVHPLPAPEYHGHFKASQPTPAAPKQAIPPVLASVPSTSSTPTPPPAAAKPTKPPKSTSVSDPPPHQIECIARVTLTIGPISYPGTELWIGRFVEARTAPPVPRREKGKKPEKRPSTSGTPVSKVPRANLSSTPGASGSQGIRPAPGSSVRPQTAAPPSFASKSAIPPTLIQRVNVAATQYPWLSVLIHKAAKSSASKEELAKLGRVVGRLSRGEGVGEGETGPGLGGAGPSTSTVRPNPPPPLLTGVTASAQRPATGSPAVSSVPPDTVATDTTSQDSDSDSDSDVDMTGPEQTGGGPSPPGSSSNTLSPAQGVPTAQPSHATTSQPAPRPLTLNNTAPVRPPGDLQSSGSVRPPVAGHPQTSTTPIRPLQPYQQVPPIQRRVYPLPPPFLLIAFKENSTEKYLLPLGSQSFVSRVGGDLVTTPPIQPIRSETKPSAGEQPPNPPIQTATVASRGTGRGRARGKGRGKGRVSLARKSKIEEPSIDAEEESSDAESESPVEQPAKPNLPVLPGMQPPKGTVLLSTFVPTDRWLRPDWSKLSRCLPFENREFDILPNQSQITQPSTASVIKVGSTTTIHPTPDVPVPPPSDAPVTSKAGAATSGAIDPTSKVIPPSPTRALRHQRSTSTTTKPAKPSKPSVLNLAAQPFLPPEGDIQPVTIRISEVDDNVWKKMKWVVQTVEDYELKVLERDEPDLKEAAVVPPAPPPGNNIPGQTPSKPVTEVKVGTVSLLKSTWLQRKKESFQRLLKRVPQRTFLRYRFENPPPSELIEVTTDRWAPRPYPISTRGTTAATSPPPEETYDALSIFAQPNELLNRRTKSSKNQPEPEVTFEMPMSFEELDESVEKGAEFLAMRGRGRGRGRRGGGRGRGGRGLDETVDGDGRRRFGQRGLGKVCEGCGREDLKVWRKGPNGRATLCNTCADKYMAGTLGPLVAKNPTPAEPETTGTDVAEPQRSSEAQGSSASDPVPTEKIAVDSNTIPMPVPEMISNHSSDQPQPTAPPPVQQDQAMAPNSVAPEVLEPGNIRTVDDDVIMVDPVPSPVPAPVVPPTSVAPQIEETVVFNAESV